MTPDDAPIPEDDAIARAARGALGRARPDRGSTALSWDAVQSGARRVSDASTSSPRARPSRSCSPARRTAAALTRERRDGPNRPRRRRWPEHDDDRVVDDDDDVDRIDHHAADQLRVRRRDREPSIRPHPHRRRRPSRNQLIWTGTITLASDVLMVGRPVDRDVDAPQRRPITQCHFPRDPLHRLGVSHAGAMSCAPIDFSSDPTLAVLARRRGRDRSRSTVTTRAQSDRFDADLGGIVDRRAHVLLLRSATRPGGRAHRSIVSRGTARLDARAWLSTPREGKWSVTMSADATEVDASAIRSSCTRR